MAKFEKKFNKESGMNSVNFVDFIHVSTAEDVVVEFQKLKMRFESDFVLTAECYNLWLYFSVR